LSGKSKLNSSSDVSVAQVSSTDIRQAVLDTVSVQVEAFLGTATMTVGALAECQPGTIVALDRLLADPVDIRVNGIAVARGELVSVKDRFAVRITSLAN
jgi:flagellar motor switch protein FliN/FliY